jgi:tetratricopeptide (TPR) repeat protein
MESALSAAPAPPASANLQNASPLHLQLLLMMGSSANSPSVMEEAKSVQRLLHLLEPDDAPALGGTKLTIQAKKKAVKAASSSSSSSASSTDDPSKAWHPQSLAKLAASPNALDTLQLAMLHDPALPWHPQLRDAEKSIKLYGLAAIKLPSTYACARLAHFYITGEYLGGVRDEAKAAKWLRMGAMKGHALCQYQLGYMLEDGVGVQQDIKQAVEFYRKAANLKYPAAMYNLATILIEKDGTYDGVEQDVYAAIRLMEDAAALGESRAQLRMGQLCFMGNADLDIEASIPRSIQYFTMATVRRNRMSLDVDLCDRSLLSPSMFPPPCSTTRTIPPSKRRRFSVSSIPLRRPTRTRTSTTTWRRASATCASPRRVVTPIRRCSSSDSKRS